MGKPKVSTQTKNELVIKLIKANDLIDSSGKETSISLREKEKLARNFNLARVLGVNPPIVKLPRKFKSLSIEGIHREHARDRLRLRNEKAKNSVQRLEKLFQLSDVVNEEICVNEMTELSAAVIDKSVLSESASVSSSTPVNVDVDEVEQVNLPPPSETVANVNEVVTAEETIAFEKLCLRLINLEESLEWRLAIWDKEMNAALEDCREFGLTNLHYLNDNVEFQNQFDTDQVVLRTLSAVISEIRQDMTSKFSLLAFLSAVSSLSVKNKMVYGLELEKTIMHTLPVYGVHFRMRLEEVFKIKSKLENTLKLFLPVPPGFGRNASGLFALPPQQLSNKNLPSLAALLSPPKVS